jgi:hypothetical protein
VLPPATATVLAQVLCAQDAELAACLTLAFPPPPLPEDPDVLRAQPLSVLASPEAPMLLRSSPLTPDPLLFLQAGLRGSGSLDAAVEVRAAAAVAAAVSGDVLVLPLMLLL